MNNIAETDFESFITKIRRAMENYFGKDYSVQVKEVNKNNGLLMHGLTIMKKSENVCPTIYMERFYEEYVNGNSLSDIVNEIIEVFVASDDYKPGGIDFFTEYEKVKSRLFVKLINKQLNEKLLEGVPHRVFIDMAIVCMVEIEMPGEQTGSVLIHNNHICMWGVHREQLLEDAIANTLMRNGSVIVKMEEMISRIYESMRGPDMQRDEDFEEMLACPCGLYVLSNERQLYGAASIIFPEVRNDLVKKTGGDFYMIPSSVHELIIMPSNIGGNISGLNEMINEVNRTMVSRDEVLSDHAYLYNSKSDSFISL